MEIGYDFPSKYDEKYGLLTRRIVRLLSENARMSIFELSNILGVSRRTVRERILKTEKELGIKYTVEFNESALGLTSPHIVLVKFTKKPDYEEVARILSSSYIPQLVLAVKGKYDLLIYANAVTSGEYVHWDKSTQIKLAKYGVLWHSSDVAHKQLGYFPLRNELIDRLNLPEEHKAILKLLNTNSRVTFSHISKTINMHFNTVAYNFNKLVQKGYIKRFTLSIAQQKDLTLMTMFSKYVLSDHFEEDSSKVRKAYITSGNEYPIINRYLVCSQLVGSYDFFNMGLFDNYDTAYRHAILNYKDVFKRHKAMVEYGYADRVLLGDLPQRSIDTKKEYNVMKWNVPGEEQK